MQQRWILKFPNGLIYLKGYLSTKFSPNHFSRLNTGNCVFWPSDFILNLHGSGCEGFKISYNDTKTVAIPLDFEVGNHFLKFLRGWQRGLLVYLLILFFFKTYHWCSGQTEMPEMSVVDSIVVEFNQLMWNSHCKYGPCRLNRVEVIQRHPEQHDNLKTGCEVF